MERLPVSSLWVSHNIVYAHHILVTVQCFIGFDHYQPRLLIVFMCSILYMRVWWSMYYWSVRQPSRNIVWRRAHRNGDWNGGIWLEPILIWPSLVSPSDTISMSPHSYSFEPKLHPNSGWIMCESSSGNGETLPIGLMIHAMIVYFRECPGLDPFSFGDV